MADESVRLPIHGVGARWGAGGPDSFPLPTFRLGKLAFHVRPYTGATWQASVVEQRRPLLTFGPIGSEQGTVEVYYPLEHETGIRVRRGCFSGSLDEFAERAENHRNSQTAKAYAKIVEAVRLIEEAIELGDE